MSASTTEIERSEYDDLDPRVHERRWLILGVLCLSLVIIVIDNSILNVAIPSLIRDLDASNSQLQWIIDAYVIVFAGLLLTTGSMSDRFGRKGALQAGLALFALGSIASASAQTADQLIFTRAFMGIGGALIMPSTLSILTNVFRNPTERGRAIGVWAGLSGLGRGDRAGRGGPAAQALLVAVGVLGQYPDCRDGADPRRVHRPQVARPRQSRLDPLGAVLSIAGLVTLLFGIIEGPSKGWTSTQVLLAFGIAIVTLASFVLWEFHTDTPMLDMSLFKNPRFSAASSTITLMFFALFGSLFLITQYWQLVHGYSALEAGVRLVPFAMTMMIIAPLSARLVEKFGTKTIVLTGLSLVIAGLSLLSTLQPHTPFLLALAYFMIMGAGMGMTMAPATESVMGSLPREKAGVGSAVNDTTRQVGGALGVAIVGSTVSSVYASRISALAGRFGLDAATSGEAQSSLGGAQRVGAGLGTQASAFVSEANKVFVEAMAIGMRVGVVVVAFAAVIAWKFLPARATDHAAPPCPPPSRIRAPWPSQSPTVSPWDPPPRRRFRRETDRGYDDGRRGCRCRRPAPWAAAIGRGRRGGAVGDGRTGG